MDRQSERPKMSPKELPSLTRDIQNAYFAYAKVDEEKSYKLGGTGSIGKIWGSCTSQANEALSSFLDTAKQEALPELIPLQEMRIQETMEVATTEGKIVSQTDPYGLYFLPRMKRIYRIGPDYNPISGVSKPPESKYIPGSKDFEGLEKIRHSPSNYIHFDGMELGQVGFGIQAWKTWNLSLTNVDKITQSLADYVTDEETKAAAVNLRVEIEKFEETAQSEYTETENQIAKMLQLRVNNLKNAVIGKYGVKSIPAYIRFGGKTDNLWYLRDEGKIVSAPEITKKGFMGSAKEDPDLSQAVETPPKVWLRGTSSLVEVEILKLIPTRELNRMHQALRSS